MKSLVKFLIKEFGFLFEDYPLASGIVLLLGASIVIYYLRNRVFYIKNRVSIIYFIFNLRTLSYVIVAIGISQILRGLSIYDSILKDFIAGLQAMEDKYPVLLGGIISCIGFYFIYDRFKIIDDEIEDYENNMNKLKFWLLTSLIIFLGVSMILRNM